MKRIPVVVLTASTNSADVTKLHGLDIHCYVVKPGNMEQFAQLVQTIIETVDSFWSTRTDPARQIKAWPAS